MKVRCVTGVTHKHGEGQVFKDKREKGAHGGVNGESAFGYERIPNPSTLFPHLVLDFPSHFLHLSASSTGLPPFLSNMGGSGRVESVRK